MSTLPAPHSAIFLISCTTCDSAVQRYICACSLHPSERLFRRYRNTEEGNLSRRCLKEERGARTIQRIRKRLELPRLPKRPVPRRSDKQSSPEEQQVITTTIQQQCHLGPQRLA